MTDTATNLSAEMDGRWDIEGLEEGCERIL